MKEVRPSTWVLLGVLVLIIFGPLFLLDIDPVQELEPADSGPAGPSDVRPADTRPKSNNKPANNQPREEGRQPPINKPDDGMVD